MCVLIFSKPLYSWDFISFWGFCFFKNKINSGSITQRKLMESEFVVLQLSEFFSVCWKEHGSIFKFLLLKMVIVIMSTLTRLYRALSISSVILQYWNKFWGWTSFLSMDCVYVRVCVCRERETNTKGGYDLSQEVPCLLERVAWLSEVVWTLKTLKNQLQGPLSFIF